MDNLTDDDIFVAENGSDIDIKLHLSRLRAELDAVCAENQRAEAQLNELRGELREAVLRIESQKQSYKSLQILFENRNERWLRYRARALALVKQCAKFRTIADMNRSEAEWANHYFKQWQQAQKWAQAWKQAAKGYREASEDMLNKVLKYISE